ncbi:putative E3 ubiquitin-protein ligase HERC4 [Symbiodinium microadriaticum]|uniref:Putative E3 ubiquitin-protein ligase HERC4 n=1 Tax=Symbiodinium microadriaticum TaxID=2951 RepID=A0A1Q9E023_SYMMI|nr:putative E3 ubiquitin-protein ligase HERC4 [Symbiodinium microadriaticum]
MLLQPEESSRWPTALSLFQEMQERDVLPTTISFNAVISALLADPQDQAAAAEAVFAKVRCCIFCNKKTWAPYVHVLGECHISRSPELRDAGELFFARERALGLLNALQHEMLCPAVARVALAIERRSKQFREQAKDQLLQLNVVTASVAIGAAEVDSAWKEVLHLLKGPHEDPEEQVVVEWGYGSEFFRQGGSNSGTRQFSFWISWGRLALPIGQQRAVKFQGGSAGESFLEAAWQPTLQMLQDLKAVSRLWKMVRPTSSSYMMALSSVAVFLLQQMPALQLPADTVAYNSALLCQEHVRQLSYSKRLLVDGYTSTASSGNRRIGALNQNKRLLRFGLIAKRQRDVPTHVGAAVVAVSAGTLHTCAVRSDGQLVCFGDNSDGQCDVPTDLGAVLAVSAGVDHTCAVRSDGQLVCFGDNSDEQCDVPTDLGTVLAVSAGYGHTCAVRSDGQLVCFGWNAVGQCDVPTDLGAVLAVSAGIDHTCAVRTDGHLVCFGWNTFGQCDVPTDLGAVVAVSPGGGHTCAVRSDGHLVCFGDNTYGQCDVPTSVGAVVAVSAGTDHTCAVRSDQQLVCFGLNGSGQCDVPMDLGAVVAVSAGGGHTCAVRSDGQLVCFGNNAAGQCDVPTGL